MVDPLPFQFPSRASQFVGIPDQMQAALIDERDRDLEDYLASIAPTPWTAVTFQNSWVDFGAGYQNVQYRKVGDLAQVRGLMKSGTTAAVAFTLPVGFRPPASMIFAQRCSAANGSARLTLATDGTCTVNATSTGYFTTNFEFSVTE